MKKIEFTNIKPSVCRAFTLIEVLLTIALISILAAITVFALNPSKHLADSRDAEREAHVYEIIQALYQYAADYEGSFPSVLTTEEREICFTGASDCSGLYDLTALTNDEVYLISLPTDPLCGKDPPACATNGTGYFISLSDTGRIQVNASSSENKIISITQ